MGFFNMILKKIIYKILNLVTVPFFIFHNASSYNSENNLYERVPLKIASTNINKQLHYHFLGERELQRYEQGEDAGGAGEAFETKRSEGDRTFAPKKVPQTDRTRGQQVLQGWWQQGQGFYWHFMLFHVLETKMDASSGSQCAKSELPTTVHSTKSPRSKDYTKKHLKNKLRFISPQHKYNKFYFFFFVMSSDQHMV